MQIHPPRESKKRVMACAVQRALLPSDEVVAQSQACQDIETKNACAAQVFAACINALDRKAVGMVEAKDRRPGELLKLQLLFLNRFKDSHKDL